MRKALFAAAALTLATVCVSQTTSQTQTPPAPTKAAAPLADHAVPSGPVAYQEMLNKYCITCHNEKAKIPAGAPLALEKANLKDPGSDAGVWEKVVKKLGVGAMPQRNSPTPGTAELNKFRSA